MHDRPLRLTQNNAENLRNNNNKNKNTTEETMVDVAKMNFEPGSWQEALYEIYVGTRVGSAHGWYFLKKNTMAFIDRVLCASGVISCNKAHAVSASEPQELKVIGVGYGRTGTVSILPGSAVSGAVQQASLTTVSIRRQSGRPARKYALKIFLIPEFNVWTYLIG